MQMKFSDGQSEFSRVFNFTILGYSRNSRKLDAREKIVFYSMLLRKLEGETLHITMTRTTTTFSAILKYSYCTELMLIDDDDYDVIL